MKKLLFIDRDGTLIQEPPVDYQVDSLEKLSFLPGVFKYLDKINELFDFEFVMVTNQDGLGTDSFPEEDFWPAQNKMIEAFKNEGIKFSDILIDRTFESDNAPTRKPGIAMLTSYLTGEYDIANSYVIGDRLSDIQLAKNLRCQGILIDPLNQLENEGFKVKNWKDIYEFLLGTNRTSSEKRRSNETNISIDLNLDGTGKSNIKTGLNFFDHMLDQIAKHGRIDLDLIVNGDLEVDEHHTIEDTAIVLGKCLSQALGSKAGIDRYGFALPMDDCFATAAIDFGGRSWLVWKAEFKREKIGDVPVEMFEHFFKSLSEAAKMNIYIEATGENEHHKIESIFKGFAKAILMAKRRTPLSSAIPSSKGLIDT